MSQILKPIENTSVELFINSATVRGSVRGVLFKRTKKVGVWGVVHPLHGGLFEFTESSVQSVEGKRIYVNTS